jgi:hypothetical protein
VSSDESALPARENQRGVPVMSLSRSAFVLLFAVLGVQLGLRCARAEPPYEIVLEDEFGNRLPVYSHRGEQFAQGREGQRYNVRVVNRSGRRVEAVVTVDGRDVLSGMPGDFAHQRGYLVPAHGSVLIEGFRTSLSEVAAFRFTQPEDSYSSRMGSPENVGVIGAAFFREALAEPVYPAQIPRARAPRGGTGAEPGHLGSGSAGVDAREQSADKRGDSTEARRARPAAPAAEGAPYEPRQEFAEHESNIGTEYGEQRYSAVHEVSFERAHPWTPERVLSLRYDDYRGLVARGILPRPTPRGPSPFPVNRFAPPPPRAAWN